MRSIFIFCLVFGVFIDLSAQSVQMSWSDTQLCVDRSTGWFESFIGSDSSSLYACYNRYKGSSKVAGVRLVKVDKLTLKEVNSYALHGFKSSGGRQSEYKRKEVEQELVVGNQIVILWSSKDYRKNTKEFYVETLDTDFKRRSPLKHVMHVDNVSAKPFLAFNPIFGNSIVLFSTNVDYKTGIIRFTYVTLLKDMSIAKSGQIELSNEKMKHMMPVNLFGKYHLTDNGTVLSEIYYVEMYANSIGKDEFLSRRIDAEFDLEGNKVIVLEKYRVVDKKVWMDSKFMIVNGRSFLVGLYRDLGGPSDFGVPIPTGVFIAERENDGDGYKRAKYIPMDIMSDEVDMTADSNYARVPSYSLVPSKIEFVILDVQDINGDIFFLCGQSCICLNYKTNLPEPCSNQSLFCLRITMSGKLKWIKSIYRNTREEHRKLDFVNLTREGDAIFLTYSGAPRRTRDFSNHFKYAMIHLENGAIDDLVYYYSKDSKPTDNTHIIGNEIKVIDNVRYAVLQKYPCGGKKKLQFAAIMYK